MTRIAFIGLGIMGAPMAANLVRAGFDVTGYNRSPAKIDRLVEALSKQEASQGLGDPESKPDDTPPADTPPAG